MADGEIRIEITGDARGLEREVRAVKGALGALEKKAGGLGDVLKGAFASAAGFLAASAIQVGLGAITQGIGSAIGKATELQSELNFLQAVTGATGDQMAQAARLAKALGADITIPAASALDAAKAMTELAKAGLSMKQSMAAARGTLQLAAAGKLEAARAAEIIAGALNAFKLSGDQAVRVADLLAAAANASAADVTDMADSLQMASAVAAMSGRSIEETIAALSMLANAGIRGSDAGTSLKTMFMRLTSPTKEASDLMRSLGVNVFDARGQMLPMRDIVRQVSSALSTLTEEQRAQVMTTIFGADAIRAANIVLAAGVENYDQMYQAVTRAGAAQDLAAARTRGLQGAQEALSNAIETLSISFGEGLLPALTEAGLALADALTKPETIAFVERLGALIGGALTEGLAMLRDVASTVDLGALFDALKMGAQEASTALSPVTSAIGDLILAIQPGLDALGGQLMLIGQSIGMQLKLAFEELEPVVSDVLNSAGELMLSLIPTIVKIVEALKPLVTLIANALINQIRTFFDVLRHALEMLAQVMRAVAALLRGDIDGFVQHARGAFESLVGGIRTGFGGAIQTVAALFGDVGQQVLGTISRINDALMNIRNLGASVAQSISQALGNIRLPQLPFGGGQQQSSQTAITNNYNLNVQAAQSQGVMNDFELMRRLGWR